MEERQGPRLVVGLAGEYGLVVGQEETAAAVGNDPDVTVLSTPYLLMLVEGACYAAVRAALGPEQRVVGVAVTLKHLAPTPLGVRVTARATLAGVDGSRLVFDVVVDDEHERVGEARMESFVVDLPRFRRRLERKAREG